MVLLCSFFVDVALKLWKLLRQAGHALVGGDTGFCERKSKDQTQLNCKRTATGMPQYFNAIALKCLFLSELQSTVALGLATGFANEASQDT
jgi:hypothetical protein